MCSGRVSAELILEAFNNDAWGVMVASCPNEKCEHDANYKTRRRIILLQKMLEQFGIKPERIKLEWIDKGEAAKLKLAIDDFSNELRKMGPVLSIN
jgi:coenzyme F420-reducing hydrogenase delta subunit